MKEQQINKIDDFLGLISDFSVICVTGKMAAGKNHICSQLEQHGWDSVDADKLVHQAIEIARNKIIDTFEPYAREKKIKSLKLQIVVALFESLIVFLCLLYEYL